MKQLKWENETTIATKTGKNWGNSVDNPLDISDQNRMCVLCGVARSWLRLPAKIAWRVQQE